MGPGEVGVTRSGPDRTEGRRTVGEELGPFCPPFHVFPTGLASQPSTWSSAERNVAPKLTGIEISDVEPSLSGYQGSV